MIKFPSIEQFRHVIHHVKTHAQYAGKDENGDAIYDQSKPIPTLKFRGTIKLHGANAGIVYDCLNDEITYQSRERELSLTSDNAGFMLAQKQNEELWRGYFKSIIEDDTNSEEFKIEKIAIFGEWCGSGIQKGVAINQLPKMFVIFAAKIIWADGFTAWSRYEDSTTDDVGIPNVYDINDFPTFEIEVDFNHPELAQNKMIEITEEVEKECPVGKAFGISGIGEGVVWTCVSDGWNDSGTWFKVKGEAHAKGTSIDGLNLSASDRMKVINFCLENGIKEFDYYFSE